MSGVLIGWFTSAHATEVVWTSPPSDADAARVGARAGAGGPPLQLADLRAALTRWSDADGAALRDLDTALADARPFERELDGELHILADLEGPVHRVGALRDEADRSVLYAALLYQGFAANRYFSDTLGTDPAAQAYREIVADAPVERPWVDAAALEPDRDATAYDIAETPQRVAYNFTRHRLGDAPRGTLTPRDLPAGSILVVDGRPAPIGPEGVLWVSPGRHLVHAELEGRIVERWDVRLRDGEPLTLTPSVSDAEWRAFVEGGAPSAAVSALIAAVGTEVWLATPGERGPSVVAVDPAGARADVDLRAPPEDTRPRLAGSVGVLGGWLSSGDFYTQDPFDTPHSVGGVNAFSVGGWTELGLRYGPYHAEVGADLLAPVGQHHVALTGDAAMRLRPLPYVSTGMGPASVAVGYLFPYHPAAGGRLELPLADWQARVVGWVGVPTVREREDGTTWRSLPLFTVTTGFGRSF